jgi:hypothetical protein
MFLSCFLSIATICIINFLFISILVFPFLEECLKYKSNVFLRHLRTQWFDTVSVVQRDARIREAIQPTVLNEDRKWEEAFGTFVSLLQKQSWICTIDLRCVCVCVCVRERECEREHLMIFEENWIRIVIIDEHRGGERG